MSYLLYRALRASSHSRRQSTFSIDHLLTVMLLRGYLLTKGMVLVVLRQAPNRTVIYRYLARC